jgi:hypothetical protein
MPLIILVCIVVGVAVFFFAVQRRNSPKGKTCCVCGAVSLFGYSTHAEQDANEIRPMCLKHLTLELGTDYESFHGRAVVVEPAPGPPCYVFQPIEEWGRAFKNTKITDDTTSLISKMDAKCHDCGQGANYLWAGSKGLNGENFGETLEQGISATLLRQNLAPVSLCPKCCVKRISNTLKENRLSYLEVCAPKGNGTGFVIPMGY